MNKKLKIIFMLLCLLSILLFGCSSSFDKENIELKNKIALLENKNISLEKQIADMKKENEELSQKLKEQERIISKSAQGDNIFPIYRANINSYENEIDYYITIENNKSLKEKLDVIAKKLSEEYFDNLPIEILKIENIKGKKVATVNLKEVNQSKMSWAADHFQGSGGGTQTSVALIETFLQRGYKGQWIDGVKFLYEGKDCNDFQHVPDLSNINYR